MVNIEVGTSEKATSEEVKEQRIEGENPQQAKRIGQKEAKYIEQISKETVIGHIVESGKNQGREPDGKMSKEQLTNEGIQGDNKGIILKQVMGKLASLSQQGKQLQVKRLLERHGVSKVTELKPQHYEALLYEAESI